MFNRYTTLFFISLTFILAACGGGGTQTAQTGPAAAPPTEEPALPAGDPLSGETMFTASCSSCHGEGGKGVVGVGQDLTVSEFTAGLTDAEFLDFIKTGRPTGDPANTTGIDMPPKGGNPALSDDQILDIIAYLRSIHQ